MLKLSINLPKYNRLVLSIQKRRGDLVDPLFPRLEDIKNTRTGSKVSRFFRHIFEHKNIKRVLGVNFTLLTALSMIYPTQTTYGFSEENEAAMVQNVLVLTTQKGIQYPTAEVKITQGYKIYHPGLDLDGETGDPIKPIMAGVVEATNFSNYGYGNAVLINHGENITSLYAHLSYIFVKPGFEVTKDTVIGVMGATGRAFGSHLHLEVRESNYPINPQLILQ